MAIKAKVVGSKSVDRDQDDDLGPGGLRYRGLCALRTHRAWAGTATEEASGEKR
jgi:hypothetical protein